MVIWEIVNMESGLKDLVQADNEADMVDALKAKGFDIIDSQCGLTGKVSIAYAIGDNRKGEEITAMPMSIPNVSKICHISNIGISRYHVAEKEKK